MKPIYITLLLLLCFFSISHINAQSEYDIVIDNLNKIKKEKSHKSFQLDSTLIECLKLIKNCDLRLKKVDNSTKDLIRSILHSKGNRDYNVEFIEASLPKTKNSDKILAELQGEKFKNILTDTLYNNVGIILDEGNITNKLWVLATQNCIQWDDVLQFEHVFKRYAETINYTIVSGKSKLKTLYFNAYEYAKGNKIMKNENEIVNIDSLNRFEIKVERGGSGEQLDIEVIDANGKVVSYYLKTTNP